MVLLNLQMLYSFEMLTSVQLQNIQLLNAHVFANDITLCVKHSTHLAFLCEIYLIIIFMYFLV
jgi:hypothetical protein